MQTLHLAVIMTCHNRRAKTLTCLEALYKQELPSDVESQVYLVDDGSTDGTKEAVRACYPAVKVLLGNGNLFWNGGMRLAFASAIKSDYDYYLWLNDDTLLYPNALNTLLKTSRLLIDQGYERAIVIGSTQDPETGVFTYGGMVRKSRWHPLQFAPLEPSEEAKPCLTMNGNCVLIPRSVVKAVSNLDEAFTHSIGDIDYGLRSQQQGCSVWVAPGYAGTCKHNVMGVRAWAEPNITLRERWNQVNQPKGLPIKEWKMFAYRYAGLLWPIYWLLPYTRLFWKATFKKINSQQA
ncbi:glycosyltransferase family 2 protein [Iningainema tapete]|uniref:Glycosyltransferase family 2 protein n=1 Tax=Iningainema tapete BLCC-T55 TaxID=2748662 RepID=A0A8J7C5M2_9CYAN|nr:glycosyltransferase family 2 protein [Iningainema tapete]MBD2773264.1 glycosyltransferase family 2 protein [Iningainema tapete BLCC-T55]